MRSDPGAPPPATVREWIFAILMASVCIGALGLFFTLPVRDLRWFPLLAVGPFLLAPLESFFLTPLYTRIGRFRYYSPMLLATRSSGGGIELHVGTLYDYATFLEWKDRGPRAARIVTREMLEGLLRLTDEVEAGVLSPETQITGTSYFFSDRSAARFGFELKRAPPEMRLNLAVAILGIALRLSFTRGRITFPQLDDVRQVATTAGKLLQHREVIEQALRVTARRARHDG